MSGAVVRFNYAGGTNPGSKRTVYFSNEKELEEVGFDLDKQELRTFKKFRMSNVEKVPFKAVRLDDLPDSFDVNHLDHKYEEDGYKTVYDEEMNLLIAFKAVVEPKLMVEGHLFYIKNGDKTVKFYVEYPRDNELKVVFYQNGKLLQKNVARPATAEDVFNAVDWVRKEN